MASPLERLAARLANDEPVPVDAVLGIRSTAVPTPTHAPGRAPPTPPARADYLALQKAVLTTRRS